MDLKNLCLDIGYWLSIPDTSLALVSGCPEQTVVRRGSSVFCEAKVPKPNASECKPLERMSVFAGKSPVPMLILIVGNLLLSVMANS